ncbi:MAG: cbb3-type cytochrome c oxidase subunit I, partial [Nitrospinae bacterium]|nr:cbb3-type cytochrome c oxidase subunit I [Nitrospinota bacterium]
MGIMATFALFGSIYHWFPKFTGRMYNEMAGKIGFWLNFIGVNVTFLVLFDIGVRGMPRRYYDYAMFPQFEFLHKVATVGAFLVAVGMTITILNWIISAFKGAKATDNPWGAKSLEWTHTTTPPGPGNFPVAPVVDKDWSPYNYGGHTAKTI